MSDPGRLDDVRDELVRLGYLSHRVDRYLLQDALAPRSDWATVARLAAREALLVGGILSILNTVVVAWANALWGEPLEVAALYLHLLVPTAIAVGAGFAALLAGFRLLLAVAPRRGLGIFRRAVAAATALGLLAAGAWIGREFFTGLGPVVRIGTAVVLGGAALAIGRLVADGLLAYGVRVTRRAPERDPVGGHWGLATAAAGWALVVALAWIGPGAAEAGAGPALPIADRGPLLLVGVDGLDAADLDYRLAQGELPGIGRLVREEGAAWLRYERPESRSPAELWTTVGTGREATAHGVTALDGYRPLGVGAVLARLGSWRAYFRHVAAPLGLAEQRPLLSSRRRVPMLWELAGRGGRPVAAINWWSTYPAEVEAGLVVAHGAFERLGSADPGLVAPESRREDVVRAARESDESAARLFGPEPEPVRADELHRRLALAELASADARFVAVYLPALDVLAGGAPESGDGIEAIRESELARLDALVGAARPTAASIVVVFDPGRRGGSEGRLLLVGPPCADEGRRRVEPLELGSLVARLAGLPQSRELTDPPPVCRWPEPPMRVPTYGAHAPRTEASETVGEHYLGTLRSLGYL